jgi:hypothetical protein
MEDNVFRFAAFINEFNQLQERGVARDEAIEQAGAFAKYAMIDYGINAKGINTLRQTILPFLAWPYRAVPKVMRIAYTKPWKIINLMTAMYVINALAYAAIDGEDEEEERRLLPSYMKQKIWGIGPSAYVRMPWGDKDNPVFWGAGKYLPGSDLTASSENGAFGLPNWPSALNPGGPAVSAFMSMIGYDSFQGRTMWKDTNSASQNAAESLKYLIRQMSPVSPDKALLAMGKDKHGIIGNDVNHMYALSRYFGSRLYQVNMGELYYSKGKETNALLAGYKTQVRAMARAESRLGNANWDKMFEEQAAMTARLHDKLADIQGED